MKRLPRPRRRFFRPILRPFAGRRLAPELRASRVGAIAGAVGGLADPRFEELLRRLAGGPVLGGNETLFFTSGETTFAAMREAVEAAEREVLLESYIFRDDTTGRQFADVLAAAVRRGVPVRVLTDAVGSAGTRQGFWQDLLNCGIEVRLYHPILSNFSETLLRDHRKILVVDRRVGFTGGMNIGEEYGSLIRPPGKRWRRPHLHRRPPLPRALDTWRDSHLRVSGPAAWELATVFTEGWERAGGEPLALSPLPAAAIDAPGARVLVVDSRPGRGQIEAAAIFAAIVGAAEHSVYITNAYFAPGRPAVDILGAAAARGVDVRLLLPGRSDVPLLRHAGHGYFADLLASGVKVFEYQQAILHAKTLVADGRVAVVGSSNLDFRSFVFNAECNLVVLDAATGAVVERAFRTDLGHSIEVGAASWAARSLPHRLGDAAARLLSPLL